MSAQEMKVLHIAEAFDGGVVAFLRHVLPAQRARGIDVSLLCSPRRRQDQRGDIEHLRRHGVRVHLVRMSRGPCLVRDATALVSIVGFLRKESPGIVHTHCFKAGFLGRLAARIVGRTAVVHTPHCFPFMRTNSRFVRRLCRLAERRLARWGDCLMLVSESQKKAALGAGIGRVGPCEVIPNGLPVPEHAAGCDKTSLRQEVGLPADALVVGTVCRLVDYKCVEHFLRAAEMVAGSIPNVIFLVLGDGPLKARLVRLADDLRLGGAVRFLGHRPDAEHILRVMDVCVLCSRAEGMPYVLLEAMSAGVPVVASDVPGNADLIEDGRTGLLYAFGRLDQLAERIVRCLADPSLGARLGDEARRHVVCHYRLDEQVEAMVRLYRRLVCQTHPWMGEAAQGVSCQAPSTMEERRCL